MIQCLYTFMWGWARWCLGQLLRNAKSRMDACPVIWAFETGTEQSQQKFLSWDLTLVLVTSLFTLSLIQLLCCCTSWNIPFFCQECGWKNMISGSWYWIKCPILRYSSNIEEFASFFSSIIFIFIHECKNPKIKVNHPVKADNWDMETAQPMNEIIAVDV